METVKVNSFGFKYSLGSKPALKNINFTEKERKLKVVCGPTGCRQSTPTRRIEPEVHSIGKSEERH